MSSTTVDNLSRKKLKELFAAIGSRPSEDATQPEAAEYNWYQPHCFSVEQLRELDNFAKDAAVAIAQKFADFYHSDFNVAVASTTQLFADEFLKQVLEGEQHDYYLSFGVDQDQPCGVIGIPPQPAAVWTKELLGDSESAENSGKDLSELEEALLLDIASAIVEAISSSQESFNFQPADDIVKGRPSFELHGTEELCKITFNIKKADSENGPEVHILVLCDKLVSIVGKTVQDAGVSPAKNASKAMLDHLREMPVSVMAQLASIVLSFEELASLQAGDILLLDKSVDEPAELIVEGLPLFRGRPAKSAGKYAVVITELSENKPQK
jgi:flagellar motor switch protein FliM